jgi:Arsenate reductase and related proteins, glutaredoxin family
MGIFPFSPYLRCCNSSPPLEILIKQNAQVEIVLFLENPLSAREIPSLLDKFVLCSRDIIRKGEDEYKPLNLKDHILTENELINFISEIPRLIERPIFVKGDKAVIGRPPENVFSLFCITNQEILMEPKSFFQRLKENPFSWLFSGELFFLTLHSLFLIVVLTAIISFIASFFTEDYVDPTGKPLVLIPAGPIVEQVAGSNVPLDIIRSEGPSELYVGVLLEVLEAASKDKRITDIVLRLDNVEGTGQAVLYDVGNPLLKVRDSGKNILPFADSYSRSGYYFPSRANEIIMNPDGPLGAKGFGRSRLMANLS